MSKHNQLQTIAVDSQVIRERVPFDFRIVSSAKGGRALHIRSRLRGRGELIIARHQAYDFMEQVIHFVAALNKTNCESS